MWMDKILQPNCIDRMDNQTRSNCMLSIGATLRLTYTK